MIKIGTDFSGIGSPEMALKYIGIEHRNIFACDIDKYARQSFNALHDPETMFEDITKRNHEDIENLDLYVAGFPCQSFSMSGQRKGFDETRGTLFFDTAKFIKVNQPKCFILENVQGLLNHDSGRTFQTIIDLLTNNGGTINGQMSFPIFDDGLGYHVYYKLLNSKDFGVPQNRVRIFIIGFKDFKEFTFPKPTPLTTYLEDVLEEDVDEKYNLSEKIIKGFEKHKIRHKNKKTGFGFKPKTPYDKNEIANCLRANPSICPTDNIIIHSTHTRSAKRPSLKKNHNAGGHGHLSKSDGTTYCLDAQNSQAVEIKGGALRKRNDKHDLELRKDNLSNCLTTIYTDSLVSENSRIRRLTPKETWRLQGFKDDDFAKVENLVSNSQLYKQSGNSITINVMMALYRNILPLI